MTGVAGGQGHAAQAGRGRSPPARDPRRRPVTCPAGGRRPAARAAQGRRHGDLPAGLRGLRQAAAHAVAARPGLVLRRLRPPGRPLLRLRPGSRSSPAATGKGQPRCGRCPDRDDRDPLAVLAAVVAAADPSLTADTVTAAAQRVFSKTANLRKLAWAIEENPGLLTGGGARAPIMGVLRLIDELARRGAEHHPPGMRALPPCHAALPADRRAVVLPQLRGQDQGPAVRPVRHRAGARRPRRERTADLP